VRRNLFSEILGTFWIVFAGTGAIIINDVSGGVVTHVGVAMVFGLIVFAMIAALGDVSGAHFNPAVSIAFWLAKRFPLTSLIPYVLAQFSGALLASVVLAFLFPQHQTLGATLPTGSAMQSWVLECILTFGLMFVILNVSTGSSEKGITAGLAIGAMVGLEALFAGPICGASMNPVRSLAPALVSGHLEYVWIYLTAPVIGAALAVAVCLCTRGDCCSHNHEDGCK